MSLELSPSKTTENDTTFVRMRTGHLGDSKSVFVGIINLRPAGGVKHSDSDLVETRMLSAKKHFAE